jgi:glycosyltransferase involved in cell wall biosynthesis
MRILLLAPQPFLIDRGTPLAVKFLAEALRTDGCRIDLVCFNEGADINVDGVELSRVGTFFNFRNIPPGLSARKLILDCLLFFRTLRMLFSRRYDVIHAVEESAVIAMILCPFFRTPYIVDVDSDMAAQVIDQNRWLRPLNSFLRWFELLPARFATGAVVCSDLLAEPIRTKTETPVFVLKDVSLVGDTPLDENDDPLHGLVPTHSKIAMYIGNLASYQGIDLALESFVRLRRCVPDVIFVIVGGTESSIAEYQFKTRRLDLDGVVQFVGPRPVAEIGMWMQRADILISPRTVGVNTPMKIYSYMDSGTPIVATDLLTHTQVLSNNLAELAPPNAAEFSEAIASLLENPDRAKKLADSAREYVRREHSLTNFRANVKQIYSTLFEDYPTQT